MNSFLLKSCIAIVALVVGSCNDPVPGRIHISLVEYITHNSVVIQNEIVDVGKGVGLQFRGICAHKTKIPVSTDLAFIGRYENESGVLFRTGVSGLEPGTRYILRAYCETNEGIFYSDTFSIRTLPVELLTDSRDGKLYPVKKLGSQTWMIQNLNYASPGSILTGDGKKTIPGEFGRLYPYQEALVICPSGWHLPTDAEWKSLEETCGVPAPELDGEVNRGVPAGGKMKEPGSRLWETDPASFATNESGFSVVPSGWYNPEKKEFVSVWSGAGYWSVADQSQKIWGRFFYSSSEGISRLSMNTASGSYSVRCVKD
jgi:uncharacterized protein (TIGR02145 family)